MGEELLVKVAHLEEQAKKIDNHEERISELEKTYSIMEKMDYRMGKMETAVDKIDQKLDEKTNEKGRKWDKFIDYIFYAVLGAIMLLVLYKVGLK